MFFRCPQSPHCSLAKDRPISFKDALETEFDKKSSMTDNEPDWFCQRSTLCQRNAMQSMSFREKYSKHTATRLSTIGSKRINVFLFFDASREKLEETRNKPSPDARTAGRQLARCELRGLFLCRFTRSVARSSNRQRHPSSENKTRKNASRLNKRRSREHAKRPAAEKWPHKNKEEKKAPGIWQGCPHSIVV